MNSCTYTPCLCVWTLNHINSYKIHIKRPKWYRRFAPEGSTSSFKVHSLLLLKSRDSNGGNQRADTFDACSSLQIICYALLLFSFIHVPFEEYSSNKTFRESNKVFHFGSFVHEGSSQKTLLNTYVSLVRLILEYAAPICAPASFTAIGNVDTVKYRSSKIIIGVVSLTNNVKEETGNPEDQLSTDPGYSCPY
ncbi:hypothetical protein TNCT_475671 [Trichonephila clavata]|uniref:Uncharacterized protein n=1 Tax=Trichonephila clavata TaxID=2740835 RepID=A0A8X6L771_TRICU|nr:hypothetical protein TNCT_475671 [Trichonephila clavata]